MTLDACSIIGPYPNNRYAILMAFWLSGRGNGASSRAFEREQWANLTVKAGIVFA